MLGAKMIPLVAVKDSHISWGRFNNENGSILKLQDAQGWEYQYIHFNNDTPGTDDKAAACTDTFSERICSYWDPEGGWSGSGGFTETVWLTEGEFIGYMGDGGNAENTTPHLHFEIYKPTGQGVAPINPTPSVDAALRVAVSGPLVHADLVAPWSSYEALVNDLYQETYGRSPTSAEYSLFASDISDNGLWSALAPRVGEFSAAGTIDRLYLAYFLRHPDLDGFNYWIDVFGSGTDINDIAEYFALSDEFVNRYGDSDFGPFLDQLYIDVLGRPSDSQGREYWLGLLQSGELNRGQIVVQFTESEEMRGLTRYRSEITAITLLKDQRIPTDNEISNWSVMRASVPLDSALEQWYQS